MSWWTSPTLHPKTKNRFVVVFSNAFYLPNIKSLNKPSVDIETKEYRLLNHTFNYPGNAKWKPVTLKFVDMNGMGSGTFFFDTSQFLWQMLNNTGYAYPYFDNSAITEAHYRNPGKERESGHHISTKIPNKSPEDTWRTISTPEKSSNIANSFGLGLEGEIDMEKAAVSKQRVAIYQVSPVGIISEAWYLINPIVKSISWGDLAYEDDALVEYELQIVYDWAILDRQEVGTRLVVNEKPYKEFAKTIRANAAFPELMETIESIPDTDPEELPQNIEIADESTISNIGGSPRFQSLKNDREVDRPEAFPDSVDSSGRREGFGGGNAEGLGTSNLFQPRESNYESIQRPDSQLDFQSGGDFNGQSQPPDQSYDRNGPSTLVTQPETEYYPTYQSPSEPSIRTEEVNKYVREKFAEDERVLRSVGKEFPEDQD